MKKNILHKKALSIIEIMVAIFVFTLGMSAVYMLISSTVNINTYNKNFIIASNLAREQIELVRNVRDTNYEKFQKWNMMSPESGNYHKVFTGSTTEFYRLENDFAFSTGEGVLFSTGASISDFETALKNAGDTSEDRYRLCINTEKKYVYCSGGAGEEKTPFYRYLHILPLDKGYLGNTEKRKDALKLRSKVYWNQKGIHDTEVDTILTDWKRL